MGGSGTVLTAARLYSNVVFAGALLVWIFNALANVIRGTGNMAIPAIVTCAGAAVLIPVSPCLIFGWGPFPRLGVAGGAVAVVVYYAVGSVALAAYLWSGRSVVRLAWAGLGFRWPLFRDILRVGAVAALVTVQTNLTIAIATGLVGRFGPAAIAGYGTGSRVEYLLIPLVFGLGGPLVAMVGTNIGAGQRDRAVRAAWIGAALAAGPNRPTRPVAIAIVRLVCTVTSAATAPTRRMSRNSGQWKPRPGQARRTTLRPDQRWAARATLPTA